MSQTSESVNSSFSSFGKKTNYNKHFLRSYLLNYGAALQDISDEAVLRRLHDWNCEWLKRPNVAISEMAMTLKDNIPLMEQYSGSLFNSDFVRNLVEPFRELRQALVKMDNKDKTDNDLGTRQDVISILRTIDENPDLNQAIRDAFNTAGPLFMVSMHLLVIQTLLQNLADFAG